MFEAVQASADKTDQTVGWKGLLMLSAASKPCKRHGAVFVRVCCLVSYAHPLSIAAGELVKQFTIA